MPDSRNNNSNQKTPLDVAADLLVYAPIGLAIELGKHLPDLVKQGRTHLEGPISTAKFVGNFAANQGRQQFGEKFRQATEPFFGSETSAEKPRSTVSTPTETPRQKADLPIAGYETLAASQILTHLEGLTAEELRRVQTYEIANRSRKTILARIELLLESK